MTAPTVPTTSLEATAPRIITILSPKGGAGKTTVATNLAVALAKRHPRQVVLVDIDLQFGDVAGALRLSPSATFSDVARRWPLDSTALKLQLTSHHTGLYVLSAPHNPAEADEVTPDHVYAVLKELSRSFAYVVVDTDPGLGERVLSSLDASTDMVLVCGTDVPSVRGLRKGLEALDTVGFIGQRRHFVLNRADAKVHLPPAEIETTIGRPVDVPVPSSRDVVIGTNEGIPVTESGSNHEVISAFEMLCDRFEDEAVCSSGTKGRFGRFRRRDGK